MKLYSILVLLFVGVFSAQTHRFVYEYSYIPNLNKKEVVKKEMMALDISKEGSTYESLVKIKRDSMIKAQLTSAMMGGGSINLKNQIGEAARNAVPYKIQKEYASGKTCLIERLEMNNYKILEDEKIDWKIAPETSKIGEYKAQKATTNWGGRNWTAWFSTDLPFQDGPYKFKGLPGLIVKMEDESQTHIMTLVANSILNSSTEDVSERVHQSGNTRTVISFGQDIPVSEAQFKKVWKEYLADPAKNMRGRMGTNMGADGSRNIVMMKGLDGRDLSEKDLEQMMKERVKKQIEENNNRIEPTLYQ